MLTLKECVLTLQVENEPYLPTVLRQCKYVALLEILQQGSPSCPRVIVLPLLSQSSPAVRTSLVGYVSEVEIRIVVCMVKCPNMSIIDRSMIKLPGHYNYSRCLVQKYKSNS